MENLNTAFDVAEKHLDIPRMLDAEGTCVVMLFIYLFIQGVGLLVYFLVKNFLKCLCRYLLMLPNVWIVRFLYSSHDSVIFADYHSALEN